MGQPPVLTSSNRFSPLHRRFACARLSQPHPLGLVPTLLQRSPPSLLTTAACSGLRPAPDGRPRRALLHLSYSYAPPFGPTMLVTHDPTATSAMLDRPVPGLIPGPFGCASLNRYDAMS